MKLKAKMLPLLGLTSFTLIAAVPPAIAQPVMQLCNGDEVVGCCETEWLDENGNPIIVCKI